MKTITYNNTEISIKITQTYSFLISNIDLANVCEVFEKLLNMTRELNPYILCIWKHYIKIEDTIYWTKEGIIRVCILMTNEESLDFVDFIEQNKIV